MALTDDELAEIEKWHSRTTPTHCGCKDCRRMKIFAEHYFAVRNGAPFRSEMMAGLNDNERETFVKLICLRNLKEK